MKLKRGREKGDAVKLKTICIHERLFSAPIKGISWCQASYGIAIIMSTEERGTFTMQVKCYIGTCIVTSQVFVKFWMQWIIALSSAFYRDREVSSALINEDGWKYN